MDLQVTIELVILYSRDGSKLVPIVKIVAVVTTVAQTCFRYILCLLCSKYFSQIIFFRPFTDGKVEKQKT